MNFLPASKLNLCDYVLAALVETPQVAPSMSAVSHAHLCDLFEEVANDMSRWDDTCYLNNLYDRLRKIRDESPAPYMLSGDGHKAILALRDHLETT